MKKWYTATVDFANGYLKEWDLAIDGGQILFYFQASAFIALIIAFLVFVVWMLAEAFGG